MSYGKCFAGLKSRAFTEMQTAVAKLRVGGRLSAKYGCRARYIVPLRRKTGSESRRWQMGNAAKHGRRARLISQARLISRARSISRAPLAVDAGALSSVDPGALPATHLRKTSGGRWAAECQACAPGTACCAPTKNNRRRGAALPNGRGSRASLPGAPDLPGSLDLASATRRGLGSPVRRRPGSPSCYAPTRNFGRPMGGGVPSIGAGHDISCPYEEKPEASRGVAKWARQPSMLAGHGPPRRMPLRRQDRARHPRMSRNMGHP